MLDSRQILARIQERTRCLDFPFQDIAGDFRLIETTMVPVIIPSCSGGAGTQAWQLPEAARRSLENYGPAGGLARLLQRYVVQIPPDARTKLLAAGAAKIVRQAEFGTQFVILTNTDLYDAEIGLRWDDPTFRRAESLVH